MKTTNHQQQISSPSLITFSRAYLLAAISDAIFKTARSPRDRFHFHLNNLGQLQEPLPSKLSTFGFFKEFAKRYGIKTYWEGNLGWIIRSAPVLALHFAFYDTYKRLFCLSNPNKDIGNFFLSTLASGGAAGATALTLSYPFDVARMQFGPDKILRKPDERKFTSLGDCMSKIYKSSGVRGLYQNFGATLLSSTIFRAFYFGGYDTLKQIVFSDPENANIILKCLLARFVTIMASLASEPFDLVRRKLLFQSDKKEKEFKGIIDCFRKTYKKNGYTLFFQFALKWRVGTIQLVIYDVLSNAVISKVDKV